ncbi:MAG: OmpA family protein [Verrucomicrobia bacterium]|nr:OmpA family protein [Verrucomicrobiota bacterium]
MKMLRTLVCLAAAFAVVASGLTGCCSRRGNRSVASSVPGAITIIRGGATGERTAPPPEPMRVTRTLPPPPAPDFVAAAPPVAPTPAPTVTRVSVPLPPPLAAPPPQPVVRELPPAIEYRPAPTPAPVVEYRPAPAPAVEQPLPDPGRLLYGMVPDEQAFARDTVYFSYDSSTVATKELSKVRDVANYLRAWPSTKVVVEGHCDERGTEEYNRALGDRRALSIRTALIQQGVAADRVFTRSFGKDRPAAPGHNETSWWQNRRGEFVLLRPRFEARAQ